MWNCLSTKHYDWLKQNSNKNLFVLDVVLDTGDRHSGTKPHGSTHTLLLALNVLFVYLLVFQKRLISSKASSCLLHQ